MRKPSVRKASELHGAWRPCSIIGRRWARLCKNATERYNEAVGSLERKVRPAMRKLEELGAGSDKAAEPLVAIETRLRLVSPDEDVPTALSPKAE